MGLHHLNLLLFIATAIVFAGIVLHGWPLLKDIRRNGWKPLLPKLGFCILLLGLALQFQLWALLDTATQTFRMQADAKVAELNQHAETLRAENLTLQSQISPRRLTAEQLEQLGDAWADVHGKKATIVSYALDAEGAALARQLKTVLEKAGATVESHIGEGTPSGSFAIGVIVTAEDVDSAVRLAEPLHSIAGIDSLVDDKNLKSGPYILVGIKPLKP